MEKDKKKIIVIAFSLLPDPGPRALRTTELSKELARQGHDVTVYVLTGSHDFTSFENDTKIKVVSLGRTFFLHFDYNSNGKAPLIVRALTKLFGNILEFPEIELVRNVFNVLSKASAPDLLISIAKPYPIHWGVALYKYVNKSKLKNTVWVADCGDPYMGDPYSNKPFYFKWVEKWFCRKTNFLAIPLEEAKPAYYPEFRDKIKVIPQGFSFDFLPEKNTYIKNIVPTFIYAGNFYPKLRDPTNLLDYLLESGIKFKFIVYTKTPEFFNKYETQFGDNLQINDYISRDELLFEMSKADFLLNLENPSSVQSPSKLIDYALSNRPILTINTNIELDNNIINEFFQGNYRNAHIIKQIERYNIKNIAKQFLDTLTID